MRDFVEGDSATFSRTITEAEVALFVGASGDTNPLHLDDVYAATTMFGRRVVHGILTASLISTVIGTKLPGEGAIYTSQTLRFEAPVFVGDTITATATLVHYEREKRAMTLETVCTNQSGEAVVTGEARVLYRPITS